MLAQTPFNCAQGAIDAANTPEEACDNLTAFWINQGVPFTSGHVVHAIRSARQDLVFGQARIGGHIRNAFASGALPSYDDGFGGEQAVVQAARRTTRTDTRTPVGTEVFVYGSSQDECDSFEFEVAIAEAPQVADGQGGTVSAAAALLNATPGLTPGSPGASSIPPVQPSGTVAVANGRQVPGNVLAAIHSDGRLCIPRLAFEAMAFASGKPVKGGEPLYASFSPLGDKLTVSQQPCPGSNAAHPTSDRLRLHLVTPESFAVGKEFEAVVESNGDLSIALV